MLYVDQLLKKFDLLSIFFKATIISIAVYLLNYYNFFNNLYNVDKVLINSGTIILSFLLIIGFKKFKICNCMISERIGYIDKIILTFFISELLLLFLYLDNILKQIIIILFMINIVLMEIRFFIVNKNLEELKNKRPNLTSLSNLLYNNIEESELILLEEDAIEHENEDLLGRSLFIDIVENALLKCSPKKTYVFSLLGPWGSGKTSIVNILRKRINIESDAVMQRFNPRKYNNEETLFDGFYDFIINSSENSCNYKNYNKFRRIYKKIIFGTIEKKFNIPLANLFAQSNEDILNEMKQDINDYIFSHKKKIIVVIDNIDRLNKEQILLIFNIVNNVFNFDNLVYLLCFDEQRIKKMFDDELNIDPSYIDKIIQHKIALPKKDDELIKNIGINCFNNMLNKYEINVKQKDRLEENLEIIFSSFDDLRQVIRFLSNISLSLQCLKVIDFDVSDFTTLEYIKHTDSTFYYELANNAEYLVSEDSHYITNYSIKTTEQSNEEAKEQLDSLFKNISNKSIIIAILSNVFPNVKKYNDNIDIIEKYSHIYSDKDRSSSILMKRATNGRFFEAYFITKTNFFTKLDSATNSFIHNINSGKPLKIELDSLIRAVHPEYQDILFELINIRITDIIKLDELFFYLLENFDTYENDNRIFQLNSQERVTLLLANIIKNSENQSKEFINKIYSTNLYLLERVLNWLEPNNYENNEKYCDIFHYGKNLLNKKIDSIMNSDKYNLFDKNYYKEGFIWFLYRNYHDERKPKITNYIQSHINTKNIFRFMGECTNQWNSDKGASSYEYNHESSKKIIDSKKLDEILKKVDYKLNQDQEKVKQLYEGKYLEFDNIDFSNL